MAANLCPPLLLAPCCNYAAVAEGNLEMVNKHASRYGGGPENTVVKSLSGVGKTTVNWLFNHIVYVSNSVGAASFTLHHLPHLFSLLSAAAAQAWLRTKQILLQWWLAGGAEEQRSD